jgi:hypothetical protein
MYGNGDYSRRNEDLRRVVMGDKKKKRKNRRHEALVSKLGLTHSPGFSLLEDLIIQAFDYSTP